MFTARFAASNMLRTTARAPMVSRAAVTSRGFGSSLGLKVGKESEVHNESRPEKAEQKKQEQLEKQKRGEGEWHEELASDSESGVKADRGDIRASNENIAKMQEETAKKAEAEKGK